MVCIDGSIDGKSRRIRKRWMLIIGAIGPRGKTTASDQLILHNAPPVVCMVGASGKDSLTSELFDHASQQRHLLWMGKGSGGGRLY